MDWIYIGSGSKTSPEFRSTVSGIPWNADANTMANFINRYASYCAIVKSVTPNLSGSSTVGYTWVI